jgi:hypothetical protein
MIAALSDGTGRSTKKTSSNRPRRSSSGGNVSTSLQVATRKTPPGALREGELLEMSHDHGIVEVRTQVVEHEHGRRLQLPHEGEGLLRVSSSIRATISG